MLDTEAVVAASRNEQLMRDRLAAARRNEQRVVVPAIVLAESITGKPSDARLWRVLGKLPNVDVTSGLAAQAAVLRERAEPLRRKKRDLTVDAVVAAVAVSLQPAVIVTGDPADLRLLTDGSDVKVVDANR
ncbi:MAG: PIN domain-containing protein [Micropruina sp.]|uniref:PIN domain-containing protein n=1 Tax=Micropruina sp. TaxID=2737536 RepID=UPI0039E692BB